jgi:HSP20 family protein
MFSLTRNLFDELTSLHREMDNLFDRTLGSTTGQFPVARGTFRGLGNEAEVYMKDNQVIYRLSIPGVDPRDVDLSITGNQVNIKAERKAPNVLKEGWISSSFYYGTFEHSFTLPEGLETDKINATFTNGLLEISIPAAKAILPRKIEVKQLSAADQAKSIGKGA